MDSYKKIEFFYVNITILMERQIDNYINNNDVSGLRRYIIDHSTKIALCFNSEEIIQRIINYILSKNTSKDSISDMSRDEFRNSDCCRLFETIMELFHETRNYIIYQLGKHKYGSELFCVIISNTHNDDLEALFNTVMKYGSYEMVKIFINATNFVPENKVIVDIITKPLLFSNFDTQLYAVKHLINNITDPFQIHNMIFDFNRSRRELCVFTRKLFYANTLSRHNLIEVPRTCESWNYYIYFRKLLLLWYLKHNKINNTPIGTWNDINQLYRIIIEFVEL